MTVVVDDFKYSSTSKERSDSLPMNYGKGGDCTFAHGCRPRQGWFHIDTSNTGLIVDKEVCNQNITLLSVRAHIQNASLKLSSTLVSNV